MKSCFALSFLILLGGCSSTSTSASTGRNPAFFGGSFLDKENYVQLNLDAMNERGYVIMMPRDRAGVCAVITTPGLKLRGHVFKVLENMACDGGCQWSAAFGEASRRVTLQDVVTSELVYVEAGPHEKYCEENLIALTQAPDAEKLRELSKQAAREKLEKVISTKRKLDLPPGATDDAREK